MGRRMEKKVNILRSGIQLVILLLLLSSCKGGLGKPDPGVSSGSATPALTLDREVQNQSLDNFGTSLVKLRNQLEDIEKNTPIDLTDINTASKKLEFDFLSHSDQKVFEALESLKRIEYKQDSPKVGELQTALVETPGIQGLEKDSDPIYGPSTNTALIAYLKTLETKVQERKTKVAAPQSVANQSDSEPQNQISPQKKADMTSMLIPAVLTLVLLGIFGGFAYWILSLKKEIISLKYSQTKLSNKVEKGASLTAQEKNSLIQNIQKIQTLERNIQRQDQRMNALEQNLSHRPALNDTLQQVSAHEGFIAPAPQSWGGDQSRFSRAGSNPPPPRQEMVPQSVQLATQYNQNPQQLSPLAIGVSQTKESLNLNLRDSSQTTVILAKDNSPNYWIVPGDAESYWLFPRQGWEPSIGTLESFIKLFTFTGEPSPRYKMVKPALVYPTSQQEWSLKDLGEIEFS